MRKIDQWSIASLSLLLLLGLVIGGCGSDSSGGGGAAGTAIVNLSGGSGDNTSGGGGGGTYIYSYADVKFTADGSVDASFSVPTYPSPFIPGTRPATVAASTTADAIYDNGAVVEPAAGTLYLKLDDYRLFMSNGDNVAFQDNDAVTSLTVSAGATLTLGLNRNRGGNSGQDTCTLNFANDVSVAGTVKTKALSTGTLNGATVDDRHGAPATARDKGGLVVSAYRFLIASTGAVDTAGDAGAANERGGDGGYVWFYADQGALFNNGTVNASGGAGDNAVGGTGAAYVTSGSDGVYFWSDGVLINKGAITTSGGSGTTGGDAGYIDLEADQSVYNTAALTANGGNGGSGGNGGYGGNLYVYNDYAASMFNSGALTANGGNGGTGGGDGGYVELVAGGWGYYVGDFKNSGAISNKGGNATVAGNGGGGGGVEFTSTGKFLNSASITGNGGNGMGPTSYGGGGSDLDLYQYGEYDYEYSEDYTPGPIRFAGDINLAGGNGGSGGSGGDIYVDTDYTSDNIPSSMPVEFVGYANFAANGGAGVTSGGSGGYFEIYTEEADRPVANPTGSITTSVPVQMVGGLASAGPGGSGGDFELDAEGEAYIVDPSAPNTTKAINTASVDVSGGNGTTGGGNSGYWFMYGHFRAENNGAITAKGGNASDSTGVAGQGGYSGGLEIEATYDAVNTGVLTATGGSGTGANASGGSVGRLELYAGRLATNSANLYFNGGNALGTGVNGSGGLVDIFSETGASTNSAGLITVAKGTGGAGGSNGTILFDWTDVTPADGTLP